MSSNRQIIEKADFSVTDLNTDGGLLSPEQANRFVRKLIAQPTIIQDARTVEMTAPTRNINKIQFNKRIMRAATSGTALANAAIASGTTFDPANPGTGEYDARAKPQTSQVVLNTSEVIAQVNISYDVIEDNIERGSVGRQTDVGGTGAGGGFIETILQLIAERAALDFEELALLGDTTMNTADPYLDLQDGWVKRVTDSGNTSNVGGAQITKDVFRDGKKAMPDQYLRNVAQMVHYISMERETDYRDTVASRGTGLGDSTLQGDAPLRAFGSAIKPCQNMPDAKGLFSNPLNFIWGIQRKILMEWDKDITTRELVIVLTARVAVEVEEATAAVVYTNIGS